jgi:hypothetical protein
MNKLKTILLFSLILSSGCRIVKPAVPEVGFYYLNRKVDFANVGKVVVFEFSNSTNDVNISTALTRAVTEALQKKHLFSVKSFSRTDPSWRKLDIDNKSSYSMQELLVIRKQLGADAVMFGSISRYRSFPHLTLGVHLKMVDLRSGELLWAVEQLWDSTDQLVERRMKKFYKEQMRTGYEPMEWEILITSPKAFNKFVVFEIAQTFDMISRYGKDHLSSENIKNFSEKPPILKKSYKNPLKMLKFS